MGFPILAFIALAVSFVASRATRDPAARGAALTQARGFTNAEQQSDQMKFVLDRETQEAERKRIETQGVADFPRIVAQGIDERLLRWKGIEATQALAQSQNAKIVIVGGKDGLPLILNSN